MKRVTELLRENKRILIPIVGGVSLIFIVVVIVCLWNRESAEVREGTAYLKELEIFPAQS